MINSVYRPVGFFATEEDKFLLRLNERLAFRKTHLQVTTVAFSYYGIAKHCTRAKAMPELLHVVFVLDGFKESLEFTIPVGCGAGKPRVYCPFEVKKHFIRWRRAENILCLQAMSWAKMFRNRILPYGTSTVQPDRFSYGKEKMPVCFIEE